jgi:hypothetical protein
MHVLRDFDSYLTEADNTKEHIGIVRKLKQKNQETQGQKPWQRILSYDVDISFVIDLQTKQIIREIKDWGATPELARSGMNRKVDAMFSIINEDGGRWTFKMPLQYLLKGWGDANEGHQCYVHCITVSGITELFGESPTGDSGAVEKCYSGITKRNWLKRLQEHLREVRQDDHKLFHRAWREAVEGKDVVYHSYLQWVNHTYEEAMVWEERYVNKFTLTPKGFNMIPGGFEGEKHISKYRTPGSAPNDLDERDRAIAEYIRQHPLKGIPNPFMSELWKDDDYYLKVIGSREKTLTPDQVREIRALGQSGYSVAEITRKVGALNETQVKNVLANKTYTRID